MLIIRPLKPALRLAPAYASGNGAETCSKRILLWSNNHFLALRMWYEIASWKTHRYWMSLPPQDSFWRIISLETSTLVVLSAVIHCVWSQRNKTSQKRSVHFHEGRCKKFYIILPPTRITRFTAVAKTALVLSARMSAEKPFLERTGRTDARSQLCHMPPFVSASAGCPIELWGACSISCLYLVSPRPRTSVRTPEICSQVS